MAYAVSFLPDWKLLATQFGDIDNFSSSLGTDVHHLHVYFLSVSELLPPVRRIGTLVIGHGLDALDPSRDIGKGFFKWEQA